MKPVSALLAAGAVMLAGCNNNDHSEALQTDRGARTFQCSEPLPEFTLGPDSDPSAAQLAELCSCIWRRFPEGSWERETMRKAAAGEDPGWRGMGLAPRFGAAVEACGGLEV